MAKDEFTREWILTNGVPIVKDYRNEGLDLTLRALHYRLVAAGMTNTIRHYKRVIAAMTQARWQGLVEFDDFKDHDRTVIGSTNYTSTNVDDEVSSSMNAIEHWLEAYHKNRWENQPNYVEVFIEKKALQGVFDKPCSSNRVALCPCKGYPSLTYVNDAVGRFQRAKNRGKKLIILYFGDYDPSGEDIPRNLKSTMLRMGVDVDLRRIALMEDQVIAWELPPAPAKLTDSRTANWGGLGQVELDAVEPRKLMKMVQDAIDDVFDYDLHSELMDIESEERIEYRAQMKEQINDILDNE